MKRFILIFFCFLSTNLCKGQKQVQLDFFDDLVAKKHAAELLKADIDFLHLTLKQHHPNLYLYISKKQLDFKFDSLKNSIVEPLSSRHFKGRLLSVLQTIGDGHLQLNQDFSSLNLLDSIDFTKYNDKVSKPIYQFNYKVVNNRLYVFWSAYDDKLLKAGTEILAINGIPSEEIITTINRNSLNGDGFSTFFKDKYLNSNHIREVYSDSYEHLDTVVFTVKKENKIIDTTFNSKPVPTNLNLKSDNDYSTKIEITTYSDFAKISVSDFGAGSNWEENFKSVCDLPYLVLDLRYNSGGRFSHMYNVLRYLIDKPTKVVKMSKKHCSKEYQKPIPSKEMIHDGDFLTQKLIPAEKYKFTKPVYVLVNGLTFSAGAVLASKLKELKNVTIVGEGIGGGYHYTAGYTEKKVLPNSKLTIEYGLLPLATVTKGKKREHNLLPDIKTNYTIEDYLKNKDVEWDLVTKILYKKISDNLERQYKTKN